MHLHTFKARSLSDALRLVRERLGPDASVLHTREVRGTLSRWLGGSEIEVTASAEIRVPSRLPEAIRSDVPTADEFTVPPAELHNFRRKYRADLRRVLADELSLIEELSQTNDK